MKCECCLDCCKTDMCEGKCNFKCNNCNMRNEHLKSGNKKRKLGG